MALAGHLTLWTACHNYWYGKPLSNFQGDILHSSHALAVFAIPIAALVSGYWDLPAVFAQAGESWACLAASMVFRASPVFA